MTIKNKWKRAQFGMEEYINSHMGELRVKVWDRYEKCDPQKKWGGKRIVRLQVQLPQTMPINREPVGKFLLVMLQLKCRY